MQQLEDDVATALENAQHLRKTPCQRPAHLRDPRPQHARPTGPLNMAPEAVRIARAFAGTPASRSVFANAAFLRRLHEADDGHVWPADVVERVAFTSVWPRDLRNSVTGEVEKCVHELLFSSPDEALLQSRMSVVRSVSALPYWEQKQRNYLETLCKPVPIGIAAGISAVLALGQTGEVAKQDVALTSVERSADLTASRGIPREYLLAAVATPAPGPTTTTTTSPPPTTTTAPPATTTTAKPKVVAKPPATVPASTSQCSTSKAAAHACWDGLLAQYSWNTTAAFNIMWCESKGNPNARNPHSTATGLFQILGGPTDPAANVKLAYQMYSKRGWQPWVCRP